MSKNLFLAEMLNGLTNGLMTGMEMRRKRDEFTAETRLKERELDIKERGLTAKTETKTKAEMDYEKWNSLSEEEREEYSKYVMASKGKDTKWEDMMLWVNSDEAGREQLKGYWQAKRGKKPLSPEEEEYDALGKKVKVIKDVYDIKSKQGADERARKDQALKEKEFGLKEKGFALKEKEQAERIKKMQAEVKRLEADVGRIKAQTQSTLGKANEGRKISQGFIDDWSMKQSVIPKIDSLMSQTAKLKDKFGYFEGRGRSALAVMGIMKDKDILLFNDYTNLIASTITKAEQGTRPSDYDAKRYLKLVPKITDPDYKTALAKGQQLKQALLFEQRITYEIMKAQGFDLKGIKEPSDVKDPLGQFTAKQVAQQFISESVNASTSKQTPAPSLKPWEKYGGKK